MSQPLIVGNWKMHGGLHDNAERLTALRTGMQGTGVRVAVCVPAPYLAQAQAALSGSALLWGA